MGAFDDIPMAPAAGRFDDLPLANPSAGDYALDAAKGGGVGVAEGLVHLFGSGGDLRTLSGMGVDYIADKLGVSKEGAARFKSAALAAFRANPMTAAFAKGPASAEIKATVVPYTGEFYQAKYMPGQFAQTVGKFLPASFAGPAGWARNALMFGVVPGLASETAGQLTAGKPSEPWWRAGAALGAGGFGALLSRPSTAAGVLSEAAPNLTPQIVNEAQRLMQDAATRGIRLRWDEAIQQVTNSGTMLGDVGRVAEASQRGGGVMRQFSADRPQAIENAARNEFDLIAPPNMNPSTVGPAAAEAAGGTINRVREGINDSTRSLYERASLDRVPNAPVGPVRPGSTEAQFQSLMRDPRYTAALEQVRNHPELGSEFAHLPDNAIPVIDAVKKLLRTRAEVTPQADATERYLGSLRSTAAENASNVATRASAPQAQAVAEQELLRQRYLNPLEQSATGKVAQANTTEGATNALFPKKPLAGSDAETAVAVRAIARTDENAARDLVRQHAERTFNSSRADLIGGQNQAGGAKFRSNLIGDPQAERNLRAAVQELPNGRQLWDGFSRFLEILQATGRRQDIGSKTEFNRLLTRGLEGGGIIGEVGATAASPSKWMSMIRDRYQQYRYGQNTEELARILTDPNSAPLLRDIAMHGPGNARSIVAAGRILANTSQASQQPRQ